MSRYSTFLVLFLLFIFEGTVFQILAPDQYGVELLFIPRWVFMVIIFIGIFRGRGTGMFYGIVFGVMYDVIHTSILGVYAFGMGFIAYLLSISIPFFQRNLLATVLTAIVAAAALDYYVYGMMYLLGVTSIQHPEFLYSRFLPSLAMNFSIIAVFAIPLRKWIRYVIRRGEEEEKL
ncbi:rod shape-determining protein MreD [Evansella caseinilytica]|uniref:Rod shape-determining protein MreD n=1 Tax=Evansella caseinilytica TaxID=1503961 RepID=A0A1H3PSJ3_9BACI|nr:rod shape-determining protein MreD [Evansella caseinilytica]SDZ03913.1 rod shape-determining protein MreD [Evansella caseinilytica]